MNASDIIELIKEKHWQDIVVTECRTGPSKFENPYLWIIDVIVIPCLWSEDTVIAYEVKVDRQDFLTDEKYKKYLQYCNEFYFVCPPDVISKAEVPESCGLRYVTKNCKRLITKVKAPYREVIIPEELYLYILKCRARIDDVRGGDRETNVRYWRKWLAEKEQTDVLGHSVGKRMKELVKKQIEKVGDENRRLRFRIKRVEEVEEILPRLGVVLKDTTTWGLEKDIKRALEVIPGDLIEGLVKCARELRAIRRKKV